MSQKRQNDEFVEPQTLKKFKLSMSSKDGSNVVMPWEDTTIIHIEDSPGQSRCLTRWEIIESRFSSQEQIQSPENLVSIIRSYNVMFDKDGTQFEPEWRFPALLAYFKTLSHGDLKDFFGPNGVLSTVCHLCVRARATVRSVRLLKAQTEAVIKLHQLEIASLLANAFLCTFPPSRQGCPTINFYGLFEGCDDYHVEKIKCILHYFRRIELKTPVGYVTFHRLVIPERKVPRWEQTRATFGVVTVKSQGYIEDAAQHLQVDFANSNVGGGVLSNGCVQEEIRFIICPELIVSRLFTQRLMDEEALLVIGAERYSNYTGYSRTFRFTGDFQDLTPLDEMHRRRTQVLAVDALFYPNPSQQYRPSKILRELKKIYVGFKSAGEGLLPVATGNWGCGAFRGDPQLKSLIQIMAAAQTGRQLLYLTFGDVQLEHSIRDMIGFIKQNNITVGQTYRIISEYNRRLQSSETLFDFVQRNHTGFASQKWTLFDKDKKPRQRTELNHTRDSVEGTSQNKDTQHLEIARDDEKARNKEITKDIEILRDNKISAEETTLLSLYSTAPPAATWVECEKPSSSTVPAELKRPNSPSLFSDSEPDSSSSSNKLSALDQLSTELTSSKPNERKYLQTKLTDCFFKKS